MSESVAAVPEHGLSVVMFCSVIDNFGDIGICWRLSRQLVAEHGIAVTLWVDDLLSFQRICPEIDPKLVQQQQQGVVVVVGNTVEIMCGLVIVVVGLVPW